VDGGVREDEVPAPRGSGDVAALEAEPSAGEGRRPRQHRLGAVDAQRLGGPEPLVGEPGELARAAAQVEDPHPRARADQAEKVEEGAGALVAEEGVLVRVPGVDRHVSIVPPHGID
jgi:hypothetical protein